MLFPPAGKGLRRGKPQLFGALLERRRLAGGNVNPCTEITLSTSPVSSRSPFGPDGRTFVFDASEVRIAGQTTSAWHPLCTVRLLKGDTFTAAFSIPDTISSGPDTDIPLSDAVRETINPKDRESSVGRTLADAVLLVKQ